jgi:hypothetical protein
VLTECSQAWLAGFDGLGPVEKVQAPNVCGRSRTETSGLPPHAPKSSCWRRATRAGVSRGLLGGEG